ncbi:AAA family ATPase [Microbacterium sp.]|uniref:AAA family ATPase n=1 Tax=Microbacterium sp. TaxID=51671 RepID=UPI003736BEEF
MRHDSRRWVELLIIDEAERLSATALEILRDRHDREHIAIILIGMPGIDQRFRHYPQLYRLFAVEGVARDRRLVRG